MPISEKNELLRGNNKKPLPHNTSNLKGPDNLQRLEKSQVSKAHWKVGGIGGISKLWGETILDSRGSSREGMLLISIRWHCLIGLGACQMWPYRADRNRRRQVILQIIKPYAIHGFIGNKPVPWIAPRNILIMGEMIKEEALHEH